MSIEIDIEIMPAARSDAEQILRLQRLAYQSEARLYDDWTIPPLTQTLAELAAEFETMHFLKALAGSELVGSVRARMQDGSCHIGRLIVHPEFQRRGIGRRLMHEIERAFPSAKRFELFTGSRSEGNIRLYESLGYRVLRRHALTGQLELVFMEKIPASS